MTVLCMNCFHALLVGLLQHQQHLLQHHLRLIHMKVSVWSLVPLLYLLVWGQLAVRIFKFNKYLGKVNSTVILQSSHPTLSHDGIRLSPTITTRGFYLNILHFQGQNESRHSNHRLADFNVETIFHETELKDVPGSVKIGIENIKARLPSIIKSFSTINHKSSMKLKCR